MSADNGWKIVVHPNGGWMLAHWIGDTAPQVRPEAKSYPTVGQAVVAYCQHNGYGDLYYSEYGLSLSIEARDALRKEDHSVKAD